MALTVSPAAAPPTSRQLPPLKCSSYRLHQGKTIPLARFLPGTIPRDSGFSTSSSLLHHAVSNRTIINYSGRSPRQLVVEARAGKRAENVQKIVVPDPDYRIPIVLIGSAGALIYSDNLLAAAPIGLLGLLLLFQTTRVRFVFDNEALEVKVGDQLQESGENVFVGGKNRWKYSTFVNWELWWPNFPVLVYFKEIQTKSEGQVHFFPVIFNGKQLYDVMVERAGPSQNSMPK